MFGRPDNDRNVKIRTVKDKPANPTVPPVLFMLFNRASTTRQVFEAVKKARPAKIFVAANGPRPDVPSDEEKCAEIQAIFDEVDWDCEVATNFRETNIGMQRHWYAALDWFFENIESGIILEDDCVPNPSFFGYCAELLERYRDNDRIMHVNGANFQFGNKRGSASYYFSKYPHVWGWATWRRAWKSYDDEMRSFPGFKKDDLIDASVSTERQKKYWMKFFERLYAGIYDTCDVKWLYAIWVNKGLCITPNVNMVTNIGYGLSAGHTVIKEKTMEQESRDIGRIIHPIGSPENYDEKADAFTFKICYYRNFYQKAFYKIVLFISGLLQQ